MKPAFTYSAYVERIVDADTFDVAIDLGFRIEYRVRLRLHHIDAPEKNTPEGKSAIAYVTGLMPVGSKIVVVTQKPDKYGRALADIVLGSGLDLAATMKDGGHGVGYEGGARG